MNRRQPRPKGKEQNDDDLYGVRMRIPSVKVDIQPCPTCGDPLRLCGCAIGLTREIWDDTDKMQEWMDRAVFKPGIVVKESSAEQDPSARVKPE